jgi:hypothetical protein
MNRRSVALAPVMALAAAGALLSSVPAHAVTQNPIVVCEDANNTIDADFTSNVATVKSSVYHGCVSLDAPSIVYGVVQPASGTVTGNPTLAGISVPDWKIKWYSAEAGLVATTDTDINTTYAGPLATAMVGTMTSTDPGVSITIGTASRACITVDKCTYYNTAVSSAYPYL